MQEKILLIAGEATADRRQRTWRARWRRQRQASNRCAYARARFLSKSPDACEENLENMWEPRDRFAWWRRARLARRLSLSCLCGDTRWRDCSARPHRRDRLLARLQT